MQKQQVKMRVLDWWNKDCEENFYNNFFIQILQKKYDVVYSDKPDFILYGPFGYEHLKYDCVRIFHTGENIRPDYNIADYSMDFDYIEFEDRHLRLPHMFWVFCDEMRQKEMDNRISLLDKKEKFCGFMVSNNALTDKRDMFFEALSKYKRVDSGGRWKNNMGGNVDDKIEWLKSYKFNLCFENSSYPGYLTEKLFDAFLAGCVPIYWGDTSLRVHKTPHNNKHNLETKFNAVTHENDDFDMQIPHISTSMLDYEINPKAFINAHNFPTFKDLIEEIKRIDNDSYAFESMLREPIFLNDFNPHEFYATKIAAFLNRIVSQGAIQAKRRGDGFLLKAYREFQSAIAENTQISSGFFSYCVKHGRVIQAIRDSSKLPKRFSRFIRRTRK
ncbi:glycosyltransferase family 10 domain-containing protein [Helicobacter bilis]|uniref:glycosyltransferase family 10 domain-containing protein n=1 Tax=Helicobacter bilis TaxID=37372 RepID=UPI002557CE26|nr:glycosyltransferase family 10 [Helicobacter bilis]